jgi:hypothetical protein
VAPGPTGSFNDNRRSNHNLAFLMLSPLFILRLQSSFSIVDASAIRCSRRHLRAFDRLSVLDEVFRHLSNPIASVFEILVWRSASFASLPFLRHRRRPVPSITRLRASVLLLVSSRRSRFMPLQGCVVHFGILQ